MQDVQILGRALQSAIKGIGGLIGSKLINKTQQPYLEGTFISFDEVTAILEVRLDDQTLEFPIDYFESAFIPRPRTKLFIFPEQTGDKPSLKILAMETDLKLSPFAPMYQFKVLGLSKFDDAILYNPELGRLSCPMTDALRQKIRNRDIVEQQTILVKVVQCGGEYFLTPMIGRKGDENLNDFEKMHQI